MEKFTWERFRTEKIGVWCRTEEQAKEFLTACKDYGLRFASRAPIGEITHWEANGMNTVYTLRRDQPYIEVRDTCWAHKCGYNVWSASCALADLEVAEEKMRDVEVLAPSVTPVRDTSLPEGGSRGSGGRPPVYWRDAESDKPMRDGEFIVCAVGVQDCVFMKRVQLVKYDLASGWEYIEDEVITHWLDNAPSLPEVVVR